MICNFEYRFDEVQALRAAVIRKPSDRGFLTRSDGGPRRAEHWRAPDRPGDFSPGLLALSAYPGAGVSSRLRRTCSEPTWTLPKKHGGQAFPLVHP